MNTNTTPKMDTIYNTYLRLRAEGYYVSESALRGWVRNGTLPATHCGRKALLYYPTVIRFLQEGSVA